MPAASRGQRSTRRSARLRFLYGVTLKQADSPERIPYYARTLRKLPMLLSGDEVVAFLEVVPGLKAPAALIDRLCREQPASEAAGVKVADIDSSRIVIRVVRDRGAHLGRVERHVTTIEACRTAAPRRPRRAVRRLRTNSSRLQLLPQPEMPRPGTGRGAQGAASRIAARALSRRVHLAGASSGDRLPQQAHRLCDPVPPGGRRATLQPATLAPRSVRSPCCTLGGKRCNTIRTCTASFQEAACRLTVAITRPPFPAFYLRFFRASLRTC